MGKKMNAKAKQALKEASSKAGSKGAYSPGWTDDSESENEKAAAGGTTPPASLPPPSDNLDEGYDLASRSPSQTLPPSDDPGDLNSSFQYNQDAEGSSPRKTNSAMASRMLALDGIGGPPSPAGAELRATPRVVMPEQEAAGRQEPLTSADLASSALSPQRSFAAYPSSLEVESALVVETNCCVCFTPASKWLHRPGDPRAWIFHLTFHVAWVLLLIFLVAGLISGGLGQAVAFNGVASSGYFSAGTVSGGAHGRLVSLGRPLLVRLRVHRSLWQRGDLLSGDILGGDLLDRDHVDRAHCPRGLGLWELLLPLQGVAGHGALSPGSGPRTRAATRSLFGAQIRDPPTRSVRAREHARSVRAPKHDGGVRFRRQGCHHRQEPNRNALLTCRREVKKLAQVTLHSHVH